MLHSKPGSWKRTGVELRVVALKLSRTHAVPLGNGVAVVVGDDLVPAIAVGRKTGHSVCRLARRRGRRLG
jgi:hypothetical protein